MNSTARVASVGAVMLACVFGAQAVDRATVTILDPAERKAFDKRDVQSAGDAAVGKDGIIGFVGVGTLDPAE